MAAEKSSSLDLVYWIAAALIVLGGAYGFVHFQGEVMPLLRVLGLLVALALAAWLVSRTAKGAAFFRFLREADVERRKVVWPTRQETFQTTLVVVVVTIIVSIVLAIFDFVFGGLVHWLIRMGGTG